MAVSGWLKTDVVDAAAGVDFLASVPPVDEKILAAGVVDVVAA